MSTDSLSDASGLRGDLEGCQARIGYTFRDPQLLEAAMTHAVELAGDHATVELWVWASNRLARGSGLKGDRSVRDDAHGRAVGHCLALCPDGRWRRSGANRGAQCRCGAG